MKIEGIVAGTGVGGCIGLGPVREAAGRGYACLALIRDEMQRTDVLAVTVGLLGRADIEILDVTRPGDFAFADYLDVLVDKAGIHLKNLPIEHIPLDKFRLYFYVSFFGTVEILPGAVMTGINTVSATGRVAQAVDCCAMADRRRAMVTDSDFAILAVEGAARFIVDAVQDNKGRMRHWSDPHSDAMAVSGWRPDAGEEQIAAFIAEVTPEETV